MMVNYLITCMALIWALSILFYSFSKKEKWEKESGSSFECGFTSYFFSRFSFSIHYFIIALLFLFLDLELCFAMPFFNEFADSSKVTMNMMLFFTALLLGLLYEWVSGKITWNF